MADSLEDDLDSLIEKARAGDERAFAVLFDRYRPRLKRMVQLRLDERVRARLDASDVLQDAFVEVARRLPTYGEKNRIPFFLWLRLITGERLAQLHRMHLGAAKRTAGRELSLQPGAVPEASTFFLAAQLAGHFTSADRNLIRDELQSKLQNALNGMDAGDRDVLAMRHFEELSTEEIADVLGLTRSGVLKRYTRAVKRLRDAIQDDTNMQLD